MVFFIVVIWIGFLLLFMVCFFLPSSLSGFRRLSLGGGRPSAGGRLLPLWWSLCFPLRGVGGLVALRWSSPIFSPVFYRRLGVFYRRLGVFCRYIVAFFLAFLGFFS